MDKKILLRFDMSDEHQGLTGLIISTIEEYKNSLGKTFYLGEFMGEHTQFFEKITEHILKIVSEDEDFINKFETYFGYKVGIDPIQAIKDEDEE
jgi:hypothetical protein